MVFGGTPVVRLIVLGLRGVPESIREAAIAYGASNWYLLRKVDLPLAAPSIRPGMNQTILPPKSARRPQPTDELNAAYRSSRYPAGFGSAPVAGARLV